MKRGTGSLMLCRHVDGRWPFREPVPLFVHQQLRFQRIEKRGHFAADLVGRVFLNEVVAGHRDFPLVRPRAAELALRTGEDGPRLGVDE